MKGFRKTKDITLEEKREIERLRRGKESDRGTYTKAEADQRIEGIFAGAKSRFDTARAKHELEHPALCPDDWKIDRKRLQGKLTYQRCQLCDFGRNQKSKFNEAIRRYPSSCRVHVNIVTHGQTRFECLICTKCVDAICRGHKRAPTREPHETPLSLFDEALKSGYAFVSEQPRKERRWSKAQETSKTGKRKRNPASARAFSYRGLKYEQIGGKHSSPDNDATSLFKVIKAYAAWHQHPKNPKDDDGNSYPVGKDTACLEAYRMRRAAPMRKAA